MRGDDTKGGEEKNNTTKSRRKRLEKSAPKKVYQTRKQHISQELFPQIPPIRPLEELDIRRADRPLTQKELSSIGPLS